MKVIDMKVVLFTELDGHEDYEDLVFETFSYGDAEYTLIAPEKLIAEIEDCCGDNTKMLEQLRAIPETVLVAIQ